MSKQRVCVWSFLFKKNAKTFGALQEVLGKANVYEWYSRFKLKDQSRPGRPPTSRIDKDLEKVLYAVNDDRHRIFDGISFGGMFCFEVNASEYQQKVWK